MRLAYGKIGRVTGLTDLSSVGGDVEVRNLLKIFVDRGHTVHLVTRFTGVEAFPGVVDEWAPGGAFADVPPLRDVDREALCAGTDTKTTTMYRFALSAAATKLPDFSDWVIWLGEHNGPCWPYPKKTDPSALIRPYASRLNHVYPLIYVLNRREEVPLWLCPDPRNVLKCDNLDPVLIGKRPIFAQYDATIKGSRYVYAGIELLTAPAPAAYVNDYASRAPFGAVVNEGMKDDRPLARKKLIRPWLLDHGGELVGHWRRATLEGLGLSEPETVPVESVVECHTNWRATITLPASCTGWATAKPWEAFAAGTVCFAHPKYDDQDHIYGRFDPDVRRFLRPRDPRDLRLRIEAINRNPGLWREVVDAQKRVLVDARRETVNGARRVLEEVEGQPEKEEAA